MEKQGIIFKRLREANQLTIKEAATKLGKSVGWLSSIENGRGKCTIKARDDQKLIQLYHGENYRKQFGAWVKASMGMANDQNINFDGAIYKYLRTKKAKMTLKQASHILGVSISYLSKIEKGQRTPNKEFATKMAKLYGYSIMSLKNFSTADKRSKNIPSRFKLEILLCRMSGVQIEELFQHALNLRSSKHTTITQ